MKRKYKLLLSITAICLVLACGVIGVFAMTSSTSSATMNIQYTADNVRGYITIAGKKETAGVEADVSNASNTWSFDNETSYNQQTTGSTFNMPSIAFADDGQDNQIIYYLTVENTSLENRPVNLDFSCVASNLFNVTISTSIASAGSSSVLGAITNASTDSNGTISIATSTLAANEICTITVALTMKDAGWNASASLAFSVAMSKIAL